jgi:acetoin utilization deacetylase AcuC-like enzyme
MAKYGLLRDRVVETGLAVGDRLQVPSAALDRGGPDFAIYLAPADPFEGDRLGRLGVSKAGLEERDRLVFDACRFRGIPVAVVMSGGYAPQIEDTVEIHLATVKTAVAFHGSTR